MMYMQYLKQTKVRIFAFTLLLLIIVLSRTIWLNHLNFDIDEARTAMRSLGSPTQIIRWQPVDWPPLYNVLIGLWSEYVSPHPLILRVSSVLLMLPGPALAFQAAKRLHRNEYVAWGTALAYAALGYNIFLSLYIRAYIAAITIFPLLVLLSLKYFEEPRRWWHPVVLSTCIAILYYLTYTSVLAFALVGLLTLLKYRWAIWRWWLPIVLAFILVLPELAFKASLLLQRVGKATEISPTLPPLTEAVFRLLKEYVGPAHWIWFALIAMALVLTLLRKRPITAIVIWQFILLAVAPIALYALVQTPVFYFLSARYVWWGLFGLALIIGVGIAELPKPIWSGVLVIMLVLMFFPKPLTDNRNDAHPYEQSFAWLNAHIQDGDVLLIDPDFCIDRCLQADRWAYYTHFYLSNRIPIVESPNDARRVWYLRADGWHNEATMDAVRASRIDSIFVGPWNFLLQLYEAPPDAQGILFDNGLRFHGMDVLDEAGHVVHNHDWLSEQTHIKVRLWWSSDRTIEQDYSVSVQLIDTNHQLIAQHDGAPAIIHLNPANYVSPPQSMTQWATNQLYVDERVIYLPHLDEVVSATFHLTVYQWWDGVRVSGENMDEDGLLPLQSVQIFGW